MIGELLILSQSQSGGMCPFLLTLKTDESIYAMNIKVTREGVSFTSTQFKLNLLFYITNH